MRTIPELIPRSGPRAGLACERPLRVGAALVARAASGGVSATTVVCTLGADDLDALESLVADIAAHFELQASLGRQLGAVSVRFTRLDALLSAEACSSTS